MNLNKDAFIAWLRTLPPELPIGHAYDPENDALSTFIRAQINRKAAHIHVNRDYAFVEGHNATPLPRWAREFVAFHDDTRAYLSPITAGEALGWITGRNAA